MEDSALCKTVAAVAAAPTAENYRMFLHALVNGKVGARLPPSLCDRFPRDVPVHRVGRGEHLTLPDVVMPDGAVMLLVYCDVPSAAKLNPGVAFFEVDATVVIELAARDGKGIIVQQMSLPDQPWAAVSRDKVRKLVAGEEDGGAKRGHP